MNTNINFPRQTRVKSWCTLQAVNALFISHLWATFHNAALILNNKAHNTLAKKNRVSHLLLNWKCGISWSHKIGRNKVIQFRLHIFHAWCPMPCTLCSEMEKKKSGRHWKRLQWTFGKCWAALFPTSVCTQTSRKYVLVVMGIYHL